MAIINQETWMLFDQSFFYLMMVTVLLGLSGIAGAVTGIVRLSLGYSWSNRLSRVFPKKNER
jgi:hypothetical protein